MKRIALLVSVMLLTSPSAFAQNAPQDLSDQSLSSILMSLKEGAVQLRAKNQWIRDQIALTERNINLLNDQIKETKSNIEQLNNAKQQDGLGDAKQNDSLLSTQNRIDRFNQDIARLAKEQVEWENKLKEREQRKNEITQRIGSIQKEIEDLNAQKSEPKQKTIDPAILDEQKQVSDEIGAANKNISVLEKRLVYLQNKNNSPERTVLNLTQEKDEMTGQLTNLKGEKETLVDYRTKKEEKYKDLLEDHQKKLAEADQDIIAKENKRKELEDVLQKADQKVKEKDVDFKQVSADVERMKRSLSLLEQDRTQLQGEFTALEKKLRSLEN